MTQITDERLDLEFVGFLRDHAEELHGVPDARAMAVRIAEADGSIVARLGRWWSQPVTRVAIVGMLLAAVLGVAIVAGARWGSVRNGLIVLEPYRAIDATTGALSETVQCGGRCPKAMDAAWSRDGAVMVYVEDNRPFADVMEFLPPWSIWRYDARTDDLAKVADCPPNGVCASVSFAPDGRSIAYLEVDEWTSTPIESWRVVSIDLATGSRREVEQATHLVHRAAWLVDGRILVTCGDEPGQEEKRGILIDLDAGAVEDLRLPWPYLEAGVSADGSTIAVTRYDRHVPHQGEIVPMRPEDHMVEVWVARHDGTDQRRLVRIPGHVIGRPVWAPDGRQIVIGIDLLDGTHSTLIVDIDTGSTRELEAQYGVPVGPITAWLPAP